MEKQVEVKSPFTGGKVKEIFTTETKEFRKEKYEVRVRYYVCEDTGEQFTTTEQDTLLFNDLYSQYRVRHGIPFPDEIKAIRVGYGLNYSQISKILGFGANQYAKYESGEVPSESNGKMIAAIREKEVILGLLKSSKELFQPTEYEKVLTSVIMSMERGRKDSNLFDIIYSDNGRSLLNGFGEKSLPKLFEMVSYIVSRHGEVFPTKLNKLMFYADFYNYRRTGQSISGLRYSALTFGPVPEHYATIYDNVPNLDKRMIRVHDMVTTIFSIQSKDKFTLLSENEKASIDYVVEMLKQLSVSEIIEASHKERCWQESATSRAYIPYDEAYHLQII